MTNQLPNEYWDSLGQNGPFLWSLFMGQQEQVQQLRESNTFFQSRVADTWDDITNVASATASAVAQAITMNSQASIPVQTSHNMIQKAKAANPKPFNGNQDKTKEFIRAIRIAVTMQVDTFTDERMKILYALSFMHGGTAQVWAVNETMAVINGTTQMQTLDIFLENVEKTFGDPDKACTAHAQLHELKMTPGTMTEDYTARFKMLVGRTGFNNKALKDAYIWGLPNLILQKVFAQVTLPKGLDAWKTVIRNLNHLHWGLMELKRSTSQVNPIVGQTSQTVSHTKSQGAATVSQSAHITMSPQALDSATPMDVDLQKSQPETCKCYNCQKIRHLANNCLEPHKQRAQNDFLEMDILDLVAKAVATALDEWDKRKEAKEEAKSKADFWHGRQWKTHPVQPIVSQSWKLVQ